MLRYILAVMLLLLPSLTCALEPGDSDSLLSGYLDTSYNYLVKNHLFVNGVNDRVNDLTQNGFTLQQLSLILSKQPQTGMGGYAAVIVGRDPYSMSPYGWNPYYGSTNLGMVVPQAYLQYTQGAWNVMGGMFTSPIGQESYNSTLDANFSRSILDGYAEPGSLTGVRAWYTPNDHVKLNAGINNGWSGFRDWGRAKTIEAGVTYTPINSLSLMLQGISGEQRLMARIASGPTGRRQLINFIATLKATNALTLIASADYGLQHKALTAYGELQGATWQGLTGYLNYQFTDRWRTSLRGEWYDDSNGYTTGLRQNWREFTVTCGYSPMKNLEFRAETRHDFSNINAFMNTSGTGVSQQQQSYGLEALYQF